MNFKEPTSEPEPVKDAAIPTSKGGEHAAVLVRNGGVGAPFPAVAGPNGKDGEDATSAAPLLRAEELAAELSEAGEPVAAAVVVAESAGSSSEDAERSAPPSALNELDSDSALTQRSFSPSAAEHSDASSSSAADESDSSSAVEHSESRSKAAEFAVLVSSVKDAESRSRTARERTTRSSAVIDTESSSKLAQEGTSRSSAVIDTESRSKETQERTDQSSAGIDTDSSSKSAQERTSRSSAAVDTESSSKLAQEGTSQSSAVIDSESRSKEAQERTSRSSDVADTESSSNEAQEPTDRSAVTDPESSSTEVEEGTSRSSSVSDVESLSTTAQESTSQSSALSDPESRSAVPQRPAKPSADPRSLVAERAARLLAEGRASSTPSLAATPEPDFRTLRRHHIAPGMISIDRIDEDDTFRVAANGDISQLATDIARLGQLFPVDLKLKPPDRFQIICGFRRIAALRFLQRDRVLARVHTDLSDEDALLMALTSAIHARPVTAEELEAVKKRLQASGKLTSATRSMIEKALSPEDDLAPETVDDGDEVDADELAQQVTMRLGEINQDLSLLAHVFDSLEESRRAQLLEQLRYSSELVEFLEGRR